MREKGLEGDELVVVGSVLRGVGGGLTGIGRAGSELEKVEEVVAVGISSSGDDISSRIDIRSFITCLNEATLERKKAGVEQLDK